MGQYADRPWYSRRLAEYIAKYGSVPPPWVYVPTSHPRSIRWRMGQGETLIMVFDEWWDQQKWSEAERIDSFRQWPPPPRWIRWMAIRIWNLDLWDGEERLDFTPWYARLTALGFPGVDNIQADMEDPKWLQLEG